MIESWQTSPFLRLRVGKINKVYLTTDDAPNVSVANLGRVLGTADVDWLDWEGGRTRVPIAFGAFSNPTFATGASSTDTGESSTVGFGYGDIHGPSEGDMVLVGFRSPTNAVILGFLPVNYDQQTDDSLGKADSFGTLRRVQRGEFSRLSKQQAEIYQDRAGAVQIIVKVQSVSGDTARDGSATTKVDDIQKTAVPSIELARVVVGEVYQDETFANRTKSSQDKPLVVQVKMASGARVNIDSDGNVEVKAASGKSLILNDGTKGVARLDDEVKSTSSEDSAFWQFMSTLFTVFNAHTHGVSGASTTVPTTLLTPSAPTSLTGKVTDSSDTVKAG